MLLENGQAGMREGREGTRRGGAGVRLKSMSNGINHEVRNGERGEERRGTLPGWLSTHRYHSPDGGAFINGGSFQTCVETSKPSPVKQKLSQARGLILGARRLRGPARVGSEDCLGARGCPGAGRPCSRTHAPAGGGGLPARVSQMDAGPAGRRGGENAECEVWWIQEKAHPSSHSETGSTESECRSSVESSTNPSVTSRSEATESGSETEKRDWETVEEETADTELEKQSGSEAESGLEVTSKPSESGAGGNSVNSSTKLHQESTETITKSLAAPPSSRPPRSSHGTTEEDEAVRNVLSLTLGSQASSSKQPDIGSGVAKDLSPIIENTEDKGQDEEARGVDE